MLLGILNMIEVKRQNVNCEDITADNMLMEDS